MANGAFKFKDNSGNVVASIGSNGSNIVITGGTLDLSGMTGLTLGNVTLSGTTQNATSASHAASYLLTSSFNSYTGTTNASARLTSIETITGSFATTGSNLFKGNQTFSGSLVPSVNALYDLGDSTHQFRHLYLSSASLYIDGTKVLGSTTQELQITTDVGQSFKILETSSDNITLQSADGNIEVKTSGGGDVILDPNTGVIALKGSTTVYSGYRILSSDGNNIHFGNGVVISGSILATGTSLVSGSSQISYTGLSNVPNGIISGSGQLSGFGFATTGSNIFIGTQTITGSLYVSANLVVQGSSSLQDVTGSNVYIGTNKINLNTNTPGIRFGGISVFDSGSNFGESGSLLWDSQNNRWLYQHPASSGAPYKSAILISGPQNSGNLGDETTLTSGKISKAVGDDHIGDSIMTETGGGIGISGSLSITGSIVATGTSLWSGSGQLPSGVVSGSAQLPSGTISGSAQVDVMSTTNITRLATTGSNIFTSNQIVTGSLTTTSNIGVGGVSSGTYGKLSVFGGVSIKDDNNGKLEIGRYSSGASNSYIKLGANSNSLRFTNAGDIADIMELTNSGNLGLGVTPSSWGGSSKAFQIGARMSLYNDGYNNALFGNNTYFNGTDNYYINTAAAARFYIENTGAFIWQQAPSGTASNAITFTQAMTVNSSGNLSMGSSSIANSADEAKFTIKQASTTYNNGIYLERSGERNGYHMYIGGALDSLNFRRNYFGTQSDVMSLTRDGNVGISTTSPTQKLHVAGYIRTNGVSVYKNGGSVAGFIGHEQDWLGTGSSNDLICASEGGNHFKVFTNGTTDVRMMINTSGNMAIGGTSPATKLDVGGGIKYSSRVFSGSAYCGQITSNLTAANTRNYILICDLNDAAGFSMSGFMNAASYTCWNISSFWIMKNYSSTSCAAGITGQYKGGGCDMNIVDLSYGGGRYIAIGYTSNPEVDVIWTGYRLTHMLASDGTAQVIAQSSVTVNSTLATY